MSRSVASSRSSGSTSPVRCLIYARYSTALQSDSSIEDQVRVCRERADAEGWAVITVHPDYAISGAVRERPGLNALLAEVANGGVDVVLTESVDRLSRDQEDIAAIFKRVSYAGARIVTTLEGEVGELHIGLKGTMSALVRRDLAARVKRGLVGRVLGGFNPGGLAYGYRRVPRLGADGEPVRGLVEIDPEQADIIRQIFDRFIANCSPIAIARDLNDAGVPGPLGAPWTVSTINGDRVRGNGILRNELYVGRRIYGRTRNVYDPETRTRRKRPNPPESWIVTEVPELRIVSEEQWAAVVARRSVYDGTRIDQRRRPKHLLSGLGVCGSCGSAWVTRGEDRWGCSRYGRSRACANNRSISSRLYEARVLGGLEQQMLDPELVAAFVKEWHEARASRTRQAARQRQLLERRLAAAAAKADRLLRAVTEGGDEFAEIREALLAVRAERERIEGELADLDASPVIALHPGIVADYRRQFAELRTDLAAADPQRRMDVMAKLRALIDRIIVTPSEGDTGLDIEFEGRLAAILNLAAGAASSPAPVINVGAG
jgi:site-specific DNA recombinase